MLSLCVPSRYFVGPLGMKKIRVLSEYRQAHTTRAGQLKARSSVGTNWGGN